MRVGLDRMLANPAEETTRIVAGSPAGLPSGHWRDTRFVTEGGPVITLPGEMQDGLVGSPRHGRDGGLPQQAASAITEVPVGRTYLAITVELVHGSYTDDLWPRPGRILIASRSATFEQLATTIDDAFARWDRRHLHEFTLADSTVITPHRWWDGEQPDGSLDGARTRLGRLRLGEQFAYVFDLGDNWQHLCTVGPKLADPVEALGIVPDKPLPCWGWGDIPDQYGRRWNGDDGGTAMLPAPDGLADLPPILPSWGPQPSRARQVSSPSGEATEIRYRDLIT